MKLTEHFQLLEFENSSTAIARGIDNTVPASIIPNIKALCNNVLEPLRQHVGEPVIISSGYRCPDLNKLVGGAANSQHMKGEACDILSLNQTKLLNWFNWIKDNTDFDQLIMEHARPRSNYYWIHVSCKQDISKNRHQILYITKIK